MSESTALLPLVKCFIESDPPAAARTLEKMPEGEAMEVVRAMPPKLASRVVPHLQVSFAASLLNEADSRLFEAIMQALEPKRAATVFMHMGEQARERLLPHLPEQLKGEIREFITYPEDSVGRIMSTSFLSFRSNLSVGEVTRKIRKMAGRQFPSSYAYVVDEGNRLVGVMNMRDLMLASADEKLETIMRSDVFKLHCFTGREQAANELSHRRYFAAPVVDSDDHILGIVKAEHLIHEAQEGIAGSIQKMVGVGSDERSFSTLGFSLKKRLPWLHVNLLTAFMAAGVVALFQGIIDRFTILAVFLPVVAGQGGNAGAQSLAIVMRGLVMREIPKNRVGALIIKEATLGLITGTVTGVATAIIAWLWYGNAALGLVVGLGMIVNLFFAGLAGASIPIIMKSLRLDPAQCSSIILTTVTDVVGFFAFLGFAVIFQNYLT